MDNLVTTPFEDLVLGSQFLPLLAQTNAAQEDHSKSGRQKNIGIFQCRQCGATFLQVKEALIHYKFHVFETHKNYFSVVVGGLCPQPGCAFASEGKQGIHFHCTYCSFSACEILDLPLHMEKGHLAFYKEVSLVLRGDDVQLNKVFRCGECDLRIQGTVSIVQHLLAHETEAPPTKMDEAPPTRMDEAPPTLPNGDLLPPSPTSPLPNGNCQEEEDPLSLTPLDEDDGMGQPQQEEPEEAKLTSGEENGETKLTSGEELEEAKPTSDDDPEETKSASGEEPEDSKQTHGEDPNKGAEQSALSTPYVNARVLLPLLHYMKENQEQMEVELNPLDLLSSLMEEDQKSDCPLFPTQHFLLGMPTQATHPHAAQKDAGGSDDAENDRLLLSALQIARGREEEPSPEALLNGYTDGYVEQPSGVFQCNQCNEAFKYQYLLAAHRKKVHQGQVLTPFRCHICGNEFAVIGDLKRHMIGHSSDFAHFCQVCGHAFTDAPSLKAHLTEHSKSSSSRSSGTSKEAYGQSIPEKPSRCDSCSEEFSSKSELTRHIVKYQGTCNPNKAESLQCATCGMQLTTLDDLKEHRRTAHPLPNLKGGSGKKGFQCDYCGKTFSCRSNLRDHLVVHTGEKPYPCDICGKSFSFIHNMKTHRLTHNEGRNEVCPYCDKAYKSKISLYYHMKKGNCRGLSTKEVPEGFHRCTECLQMFASEERFQLHKSRGHCQMSYRCVHCGIRCSSQEKLNKHLEKGFCLKPQSSSPRVRSRQKRSSLGHHDRRDHVRQEDPTCERCNYTRDCCCTFSCQMCGKRVFSIVAFTTHRRRTCPALRQRKERIRAAIMEKRKRKEEQEGEELEDHDPPDEPPTAATREPFSALRSSLALPQGKEVLRKSYRGGAGKQKWAEPPFGDGEKMEEGGELAQKDLEGNPTEKKSPPKLSASKTQSVISSREA